MPNCGYRDNITNGSIIKLNMSEEQAQEMIKALEKIANELHNLVVAINHQGAKISRT